uniref:Uncharacterized protein n=1 Tax=Tectiviridae sp. TaxID=2831614 RepID=A0A8S5VU88_9VIRU|nr:MAG TPA: hypothetical protein [Tectiviridae sp.]
MIFLFGKFSLTIIIICLNFRNVKYFPYFS